MLQNLGNVARLQGDLTAARAFYQRSTDMTMKLSPGSPDFATGLVENLGRIALDESDLAGARCCSRRGARDSPAGEPSRTRRGRSARQPDVVAREGKEFAAAAEFATRALSIRTESAPRSLGVANSLASLGRIAFESGQPDEAETYFRQALERFNPTGGDTPEVIGVVFELGRVAAHRGDWQGAIGLFERAWQHVRRQATVVRGDEAQQAFASATVEVPRELVHARVAAGDAEAAFSTLEEGRAQSLLQLMAERGLVRRLAPADLWQAYEVAQATSDRLGRALETAADADATAQRSYTMARIETERRWADVRESLRDAVPGPTPTANSKRALPADTVLAAFMVGERRARCPRSP